MGTLYSVIMTNSLHPLFKAIATAPSEQALRLRFMDGVSEYFGVQRWGIYLMDDENRLAGFDVMGVSDAFVEQSCGLHKIPSNKH